ncbi:MAG: carboxypeptidase regulatory-like domain-containing protein [Terracidiphilus sp.]
MHAKLQGFIHLSLFIALGLSAVLAAQGQTAAPAVSTTATLRGHIADPTGALIPGATVAVTTPAGGAVTTATADSTGSYAVAGLAPGRYIVQATFPGFAKFTSPAIPLAAGQIKRIDISMAIEVAQQSVTVTDESPTVNVEASGNASAIVIKGKDLEALSDDPDELSNELTALAGPSAGPNGGQIYIDGFTGGQLPPKSAIREIRINQNPFSAEFDHIGYGRIEILTKPGTDKLHGQFFAQGNDDLFNTGNPFAKVIPAYHSIQYNANLNGSLSKWASFTISLDQRNNQNDSIYSLAQAAVLVSDPTQPCGPQTTGECEVGSVSGGLFAPQTRTNIAPRIDLQLGQKNTLTARYQFYRNNQSGQIGSTSLPTQSTGTISTESTLQLSNSLIINEHVVNETRFQYLRDYSTTTPVSTAPFISVSGAFLGGGASSQSENDHTNHLELQNLTTMTVGAQAIKFGTRVRDNRDANSTNANFNGSFNFASIADYVSALNGTGGLPSKLTYTVGPQSALANVFDAALFFQDDWKANKNLTLSGGLRWETQNHIADHDDWAPRAAFAYALDGHKDSKQAKTVLRGGFGIFYDRFSISNILNAERFNGSPDSQQVTTISDPTCFDPSTLNTTVGNCRSIGGTRTVYQIAPGYRSPYMEQTGTSLERQLSKTTTLTTTFLHTFGVHQYVVRDSNAYVTGPNAPTGPLTRPNPAEGIVNQFYPEAVFKQNQMIVNVNARFTPNFSVMGFYNLTAADSDGGNGSNPSNSYDLSQDYGRASFASRNMVFLLANYQGPWAIRFNPFLIAQAGKPYNITTTNDLTGDNFFNSRPSFASNSFCTSPNPGYAQTSFGCLDTVPAVPGQSYTPIPYNLGHGPAAVAVNLRVSRAFGFGPKITSSGGPNNPGGPPPGGGGGGRGGPGGGFGPGSFGGGRGGPGGMFAPTNTGRKYTVTFNAQALNLFNDIDYGTPVGAVIPTLDASTGLYGPGSQFGKSTSLAGQIFSRGSAARSIFFQATFAF